MTAVLVDIALVLAIFIMAHVAAPLFIVGLFVFTGRPDIPTFLCKIQDGLRGES